jgi:hypothetical protein
LCGSASGAEHKTNPIENYAKKAGTLPEHYNTYVKIFEKHQQFLKTVSCLASNIFLHA